MRHTRLFPVALATMGMLGLAACDKGATTPSMLQPVAFRIAASTSGLQSAAGTLQLSQIRIAVAQAGLGAGDQFGCVDCTGTQVSGPEALVTVPLPAGTAQFATEQVRPGRYSELELTVTPPSSALAAANAGWPTANSLEITGRLNGVPFTLTLPISGTFRERLTTPVEVGVSGLSGPIVMTITLPVDSWFTLNGSLLNPNDVAQRAQIEANARASFGPIEPPGREDSAKP